MIDDSIAKEKENIECGLAKGLGRPYFFSNSYLRVLEHLENRLEKSI